jgi:hypothetical protein
LQVPVRCREQFGGGHEDTGPITGITDSLSLNFRLLTSWYSRFTDTDLDPYNAERGFWYVSAYQYLPDCYRLSRS